MFVSSAEQRTGLLVAVISGGRPKLKERPTARLLPALQTAGLAGITWIVSDRDAAGYEPGPGEIVTYSHEWAYEYAAEHWMLPEPPDPDGFFGAFPGREAACLEAERRGCWGVLQLDDNILYLSYGRDMKASRHLVNDNGGTALFADLLACIALSTNGRTVGAQLTAVPGKGRRDQVLARTGFPYSFFIERVGEGREHWNGPFEDDITHTLQYGSRADGATALLSPMLMYRKESKSKSGMRGKYDQTRSKQLQRLVPESARVGVRKTKSNGAGGPRVFHTMLSGAVRNPLRVHDPDLFGRARARMTEITREWYALERVMRRESIKARAAKQLPPTG